MSDLPSFTSNISSLLNGSTRAIVRPNSRINPMVIDPERPGWVFDIPTGENVDIESDTTDHYTEDNSFVNDHIVNKPIKISLVGLIGELVFKAPRAGLIGGLRQISGRLNQLSPLGGNYTPGFVQTIDSVLSKAQAAANIANQSLQQVQNVPGAVSTFYGSKTTLQRAAYNTLYGLWRNKTIFTVTTPWADHPTMVISSIGFKQDQDSNDYSTITISFKEFRFASTKLIILQGTDVANDITGVQNSDTTIQGNAGTDDRTSLKQGVDSLQSGKSKSIIGAISGGFGLQ